MNTQTMLRLSVHAAARAAERDITLAEARHLIDDHHVRFTDRKGNPCYIRDINGRRIKVVVAADDPDYIITVIDLDA